ncbi:MAG: hypothetical protein GF334_03210 [Candidatus Altiarchaeales archaeon]|nr:hypothetical protein [Candidatus Altiarchaeales archaeon]
MKSLVVFFSETGNTQKVAEEIAKQTEAEIEQLREFGGFPAAKLFKILFRGKHG